MLDRHSPNSTVDLGEERSVSRAHPGQPVGGSAKCVGDVSGVVEGRL